MSYFRINDLTFDIPPTDISIQRRDMTMEWSTLRSKFSSKMKTGRGSIFATVKLKFLPDELWKLHRLLIQFKNTPFWEVENSVIRTAVDPFMKSEQNIAFAAQNVSFASMVENPDCWEVTINLSFFNYLPYTDNFRYRKDWIIQKEDGTKSTVYDIVVTEPLPDPIANKPVDEQVINDKYKSFNPFIKFEGNLVEIGDLARLPYEDAPTTDVDANGSNIYMNYCNYLQAQEAETFWEAGGAINAVINGSYKEGNVAPRSYPSGMYTRDNSVVFSWKEYRVVEQNSDLAKLMAAIAAAGSLKASDPAVKMPNLSVSEQTETKGDVYIMPVDGTITSPFGPRKNLHPDKIAGPVQIHKGVDIRAPIGTVIKAPADGTILRTETNAQSVARGNAVNGNNLAMKDKYGRVHFFPHIKDNGFLVSANQTVSQGQGIALADTSGKDNTGSHCHWQLHDGPSLTSPKIDPIPFVGVGTKATATQTSSSTLTTEENPDISSTIQNDLVSPTDPYGSVTPNSLLSSIDPTKVQSINQSVKDQLNELTEQGWFIYNSPHVNNVFYRPHSLTVVPNGTGDNALICTGIAGNLINRIASIPVIGHDVPTCQHIGGADNVLVLSFASVGGGGRYWQLQSMVATLQRNARTVRMIPDSWTVDVECFASKMAGHITYVVDQINTDTIPDSPDLRSVELSLSASLKKPDEALTRNFNMDKNQAIKSIIDELLKNIEITIGEGREDVTKAPSAVALEEPLLVLANIKTGEEVVVPESQAVSMVGSQAQFFFIDSSTEPFTLLRTIDVDQYINTIRGERLGAPVEPSNDPLQATILLDDESIKLEELSDKSGALVTGERLTGGQVQDIGVENSYFAIYENKATNTWIKARVDELISFMNFANRVLSDKFYGGYKRSELAGVADFYGLEKWVLPSYELQTHSYTLGLQPSDLFNNFDPAGLVTRTFTAKKFYKQGDNRLATAAVLLGLPFLVAGGAGLVAGGILIAGEEALTGTNLFDPTIDSLSSIFSNNDTQSSFSNGNAQQSVTQKTNSEWLAQAESSTSRNDKDNDVFSIGQDAFLTDENALINSLRQLLAQYFDIVWLNNAPEEILGMSNFEDIYEQLSKGVLTSTTPCYPDLNLPGHPFFASELFTFPDFYFYNKATDQKIEGNEVDDTLLTSQISSIVNNAYQAMKNFESGNLDSIGSQVSVPELGTEGAHFEGSDNARDSKKKKAYESLRELKSIEQDFVTRGGHLEIRNKSGLFEPEPTLDHSFSAKDIISLANESLVDIQKYKCVMRRAFPTFRLFFIEEDKDDNNWRALDDFYSYNAIKNITLTRSAKIPADLLVVEMQNLSGILDGSLVGGIRDIDYLDSDNKDIQKYRAAEFENTASEDHIDSLVLREGVNVQLRLGYANHPDYLETLFNGRVVEVAWNETSDVVRIVCQSYAVELVQVLKGITSEKFDGNTALDHETLSYAKGYENTTELLSALIRSPECIHFGRWEFGARYLDEEVIDPSLDNKNYTSTWNLLSIRLGQLTRADASLTASEFASEDFEKPAGTTSTGDLIRTAALTAVGGGGGFAMSLALNKGLSVKRYLQLKYKTVRNDPRDDNIFAPNPTDYADYGLFDFTGKISANEIKYHIFDTTIWDVFQEMTYRHPGWIAMPVPYGDRMTMFFGVPSQRYWAKDASDQFVSRLSFLRQQINNARNSGTDPAPSIVSEYLRGIKLRFQPYRKYHLITSSTDIVSNDISVSSYGVSNAVAVRYNKGSWIDPEDEEFGESSKTNSFTLKAHPFLPDETIQMSELDFENCNGKEMALRYGLKGLVDGLKEMYKGSITVLGNAAIKPYDICIIADVYNDMAGPVEVEEVTHFFSEETGFITDIVPKAVVIINETSSSPVLDAMQFAAIKKFGQVFHSWEKGAIDMASQGSVSVPFTGGLLDVSAGTAIGIGTLPLAVNPLFAGAQGLSFLAAGLTDAEYSESILSLYAVPLSTGAASIASVSAGLLGGIRYVMYSSNKTPVTVIPLTSYGKPLIAGLTPGLPDTIWHAYLGKWKRYINDVQAGFKERIVAGIGSGFNVTTAYDGNLVNNLVIQLLGSQP